MVGNSFENEDGGERAGGRRSGGFWILILVVLALAAVPFVRMLAAGDGQLEEPERVDGGEPQRLAVEVLAEYDHDPDAFTQGLVWHEGVLYESTGLYGHSDLREVELETGAVTRRRQLAPERFAEGLALVGESLVQLTWKSGEAYVYDLDGFEPRGEFDYETDGWGLCFDGERLVMSDGSSTLYGRSPDTFEVVDTVTVTDRGRPVDELNELECVDASVYANVWHSDSIYRIDGRTGAVTGIVDASGLLSPAEAAAADVLNGIAYIPESGTFLITGKLWPRLFEVRFVPAGGE
jgi:glutaminyl-peptide cyclotransferase